MSLLRIIYLIAALLGFVIALYYMIGDLSVQTNIRWLFEDNNEGALMQKSGQILIESVFVLWILAEVYVRKDFWVGLISLLGLFFFGMICAFPLYLFLRSRPVRQ